jgi:triosephosphate isomerase
MRRLIVAGNWKMNTNLADATILATMIKNRVEDLPGVEIVLCPPAIYLSPLSEIISKDLKHLSLGAQNIHYARSGAFTGEISAIMIKEYCRYVILGHSERREHFYEDNELINDKIQAALKNRIKPIICVGERRKNRDSYKEAAYELKKNLAGVDKADYKNLIVAYEPVWAVGALEPATAEYAAKAITIIREIVGQKTPILYGGSVDSGNIAEFTARPEIDGALVGRASIKATEFVKICQKAEKSKRFENQVATKNFKPVISSEVKIRKIEIE